MKLRDRLFATVGRGIEATPDWVFVVVPLLLRRSWVLIPPALMLWFLGSPFAAMKELARTLWH